MHKQHYQKSQTIMGCLDELQRNQFHQKQLSTIYKGVHLHKQYMNDEEISDLSNNQHSHSGRNTLNRFTSLSKQKMNKTYQQGSNKNKKLSQLLHNRHQKQVFSKQKQIYHENQKLFKRLIQVRSQLQDFNPKKSQTSMQLYKEKNSGVTLNKRLNTEPDPDGKQNDEEDENQEFNKLFITDNITRYFNVTSCSKKGVESASAINRRRQNRRIQNDNRHMKDRLVSAMSTSNYSQQKIRLQMGKWVKNCPKNSINMNRSISQNFNIKRKQQNKPTNYSERVSQQEQMLKFSSQERYRTMKSQSKDSKPIIRIKTEYRKQPTPLSKKKYSNSNQITKLLEQSLQYIQENIYKKQASLSGQKDIVRATTMQVPSQTQTESMGQMRKAAMLHFRKIQKMKSTQSKFWQLTNRLQNTKKEKERTCMNKINSIMLSQS